MKIHSGTVTAKRELSPSLIRITLGGDGIAEFLSTGIGDEYVRVFFPHGDDPQDVSLPVVDGDWWVTPEGQPEAPMRTYTISAVRPEQAELDIDFVVHEAGVAGPWAVAAQPGHVLGLNSPTGLYAPHAGTEWQLLVADLTGIPAALRIAAGSQELATRLVFEVPSEADRFSVDTATDAQITWVIGGNGHEPSALGQIVRGVVDAQLPLESGYIWVAGETVALRDVRRYLRRELALPATHFKIVGYWTPVANWDSQYAALPEATKRELDAIWEAADGAEPEDVQLRVEDRLGELGL